MKRRIISAPACSDLESIREYLTRNAGESAALKVISAIHAASEEVYQRLLLGHYRSDLAKGEIRFRRVLTYLIVYRDSTTATEIIRILHTSRDLVRLLAGKSARR